MNKIILTVIALCGCAVRGGVPVPQASNGGQSAVVFDIDGTLTPRPREFLEARPDATKAARLFFEKGYAIIYLSARPSGLKSATHEWLEHEHFPDGMLFIGETADDVEHPDQFKIRKLSEFAHKNWKLEFAYGDSSTDFVAYATAPIPPEHVFALLREGDTVCQEGRWSECLHGWHEHLRFIEQQPRVCPGSHCD